jgi:hypothetical protein
VWFLCYVLHVSGSVPNRSGLTFSFFFFFSLIYRHVLIQIELEQNHRHVLDLHPAVSVLARYPKLI